MKPILFNTDMVRAIMDGRKTVTRRLVKKISGTKGVRIYKTACGEFFVDINGMPTDFQLRPPYLSGDVLYVREKFAHEGFDGHEDIYVYWADVDECGRVVWGDQEDEWAPCSDYNWRPSIHMPKEAARIFLRVTAVRVERLQEIDGAGIKAEGAEGRFGATRGAFANLWTSTIKPAEHAAYGWAANPWVWVIEFERCERPKEG